jgi:hypothetical protein
MHQQEVCNSQELKEARGQERLLWGDFPPQSKKMEF